jgi:hypothetical protein
VLLIIIGDCNRSIRHQGSTKIPPKLFTLMATAFVDMVGLFMILPLLPFLREDARRIWNTVPGLSFRNRDH